MGEDRHEILDLPSCRCQFNGVKLVWAQAKGFYYKHILKNKEVLGIQDNL